VQKFLHTAQFERDLEDLNKYLAPFHIKIQPKQISAPTKFQNAAAAISSSISALSASISGITWSPSIVSYGAVGLGATASWLSITPTLLNIGPDLFNLQVQGERHLQLVPVACRSSYNFTLACSLFEGKASGLFEKRTARVCIKHNNRYLSGHKNIREWPSLFFGPSMRFPLGEVGRHRSLTRLYGCVGV
jgi:hypothetical protein